VERNENSASHRKLSLQEASGSGDFGALWCSASEAFQTEPVTADMVADSWRQVYGARFKHEPPSEPGERAVAENIAALCQEKRKDQTALACAMLGAFTKGPLTETASLPRFGRLFFTGADKEAPCPIPGRADADSQRGESDFAPAKGNLTR
jgi:hypothetical protein